MNCPNCNSNNTLFNEESNEYICFKCKHIFKAEQNSELTTNPLRIFVSYGHDEYTPFAEELNKGLQKRGHKTFFDSEWLNVGCDWEVRIQSGLNFIAEDPENGRMLLIITPHSVRNDAEPMGYCLNEIAKAMDKRVTIIPVMLVQTDIPASICRLQYLDIHKSPDKESVIGNFDSDFNKICEVLEIPDMLDMRGLTSGLRRELNPIDFTADITLYQPYFTGREWVIDEIRSWLDNDNASRMFWIVGAPGIGKTTISTHLIHKFKNVKAYHFCRRGYSDKASPKRMVCSIAYQLSTLLPDYRNILSSIPIREEIDKSNAKTLFDRLIVQPLSHLASPYDYPLVILIDAIDESTENGKNEVARFIALEFDRLPSWLRVIITSRPDQEVLTPLAKFEPWMLDAKSNSNNADIKAYLNMRLRDYRNNENYCQVINTLQANADGIFQYAKCICDEIIDGKYDFNTPDILPNTLSGIYFDYFSERFADEEYYIKNIRPALEVLIATFDPITKEELKLFLDWNDYAIRKFLKDIGSYVIENSDGKLVASHASVFDWLEDNNLSGDYWIDKHNGMLNIYNVYNTILSTCLDVNLLSIFDVILIENEIFSSAKLKLLTFFQRILKIVNALGYNNKILDIAEWLVRSLVIYNEEFKRKGINQEYMYNVYSQLSKLTDLYVLTCRYTYILKDNNKKNDLINSLNHYDSNIIELGIIGFEEMMLHVQKGKFIGDGNKTILLQYAVEILFNEDLPASKLEQSLLSFKCKIKHFMFFKSSASDIDDFSGFVGCRVTEVFLRLRKSGKISNVECVKFINDFLQGNWYCKTYELE